MARIVSVPLWEGTETLLTMRHKGLLALALCALLTACTIRLPSLSTPMPTTAHAVPTRSTQRELAPTMTAALPVPTMTTRVETVVGGLEVPWEVCFLDGDRTLVTERPGRLRLVEGGRLVAVPLLELDVVGFGEGGLMGMALDPAWRENGYLYLMYTYSRGTTVINRVSRFLLSEGAVSEESVLVDGIPGARYHNGGRLAFGPDGKLYATTGDAGVPAAAQDPNSLAGKILRLNADGTVPVDNPFPRSMVYSLGHRNPQGIAWDAATGRMYSTEHGPSGEMGLCCRDEVNDIVAGRNYGWPEVTLAGNDPRFMDPILSSGAENTWAPASAAVYRGDALPAWDGNLFFGALRGRHLHRVVVGGEGHGVVEHETLYGGVFGRIRTVRVGPDGAIYLLTSNRDGRGSPAPDDDRLLRIVAGS